MRILYVISELTLGGAQKQLVELARELCGRGHDVMIHTLNGDVPRRAELAGCGVELVVDQKRSRIDAGLLLRLRATIRNWRPDVVHGFLYDGDFYSRIAAFGTGVPVLGSERSHNYRLNTMQRLGNLFTRGLTRAVVANTHAGAAFAQRQYGLAPEDVHVVWNGVRVEEIERQAVCATDYRREFFGAGDVRVACLVGAIKPAKDYHLALAAAARLVAADPAWRVLFVGDQLSAAGRYRADAHTHTSGYKRAVLRHYEALGLCDRIRFAGLRTDVPAIVRQCDVLFVTSVHEGFPNAVLEAMALGVPVVSTDYSDIRRILPCPWQVVPRRMPLDVARAILRAHARRGFIAERQKQWVLANATIANAARSMENVYQRYVRPQACAQPA